MRPVCVGEARIGQRIIRIEIDRLPEFRDRLQRVSLLKKEPSAPISVERFPVLRIALGQQIFFFVAESRDQRLRDLKRKLILEFENVCFVFVKAAGPNEGVIADPKQTGVDAKMAFGVLQSAGEDRINLQLPPDLNRVLLALGITTD